MLVAALLIAGHPAPVGAQFVPPAGPSAFIPCAVASADAVTLSPGDYSIDTTSLVFFGPNGFTQFGSVMTGVAVFGFDSLVVPAGANVRVTGSRPLALLARSTIQVAGTIDASGSGQAPGPGGGGGGATLTAGGGFGQGFPPSGSSAGGGGGGFGGGGGNGGDAGGPGGPGGVVYGDLRFSLMGGSGGGGALGAGGGGGGAIALVATGSIILEVGGVIRADGGHGEDTPGSGGGGGSGGAILLRSPTVLASSVRSVLGGNGGASLAGAGAGGGGGGGGRYQVFGNDVSGTGGAPALGGGFGGAAGSASGEPGSAGVVGLEPYKLRNLPALPGVVRLSTEWKLRSTLDSGPATVPVFNYGTRPLVPFMGDWDGDGVRTPGTFERGTFKLRNSNSTGDPDIQFAFGDPRGFALAGDWNGDGLDDVGVFRNGNWRTQLTGCGTTGSFTFGSGIWPSTVPVAGDWDGDGITGVGVYVESTGAWTLRDVVGDVATDDFTVTFPGVPGYYPVAGDWDVDGDDNLGVKIRNGTRWTLRTTFASGPIGGPDDTSIDYGAANELPVVWSSPSGAG